ncbi:flagellar hook-length control protein FliK [Paraburkholderia hayleyella]|uniref:flagellar hook-length control protein FliK n=1 Tax=Paraburkholderia hayleyella TaxID=2152889 RepID=UPI0015811A06|nr:flagellar hook-length control protein FliK [Paraburkholderia hayleyella]
MSPLSLLHGLMDSTKSSGSSGKSADSSATSFAQTLQQNIDAQSGGVHAITPVDNTSSGASRTASDKGNAAAKKAAAEANATAQSGAESASDKPVTQGSDNSGKADKANAANGSGAAANASENTEATAAAKAQAQARANAEALALSADDIARALAEAAAAVTGDGTVKDADAASKNGTASSAAVSADPWQAALAALAASQPPVPVATLVPPSVANAAGAMTNGSATDATSNLSQSLVPGGITPGASKALSGARSATDARHNSTAALASTDTLTPAAAPTPHHDEASLLQPSAATDANAIETLVATPSGATHASTAAAASPAAASASNTTIAPRVGAQGWDEALSQKVVFLSNTRQQSAELTLNPRDLGPLQVTLQVSGNHAHALFVSQHPQVREAIEAALPRLREAMEAGGLGLGSASVSDGFARQNGQQAHEGQSGQGGGRHARDTGSEAFGEPINSAVTTVTRRTAGLVDTFA